MCCPVEFWDRVDIALVESKLITMRKLCNAAGIPYQTIINQKSNNRFPSVTVVISFAEKLGCSIDWLVRGEKTYAAESVRNMVYSISDIGEKDRELIEMLVAEPTVKFNV